MMYLTSSRPDIMFAVCACARYQVNPKVSHLHAVKRIFRYLKGQPKLGLWYPKDSPFDLVAYTDSDYARASLDRKSTTGGCQFFGCRLISWQCKKQTVVANSTTEAEYVAASSCCGQVLWIQNQLLDYGIGVMLADIQVNAVGISYYCWVLLYGESLLMEVLVYCQGQNYQWGSIVACPSDKNKKKEIIITESTVRRDLQLEDAEGVDCLPNSTIFEQLTLMGKPKRKDTQLPQSSDPSDNVTDEAVHKELGDSLVRAATTASSLEAEHDSGSGPRCQDTIGDTIAQTRFENVESSRDEESLGEDASKQGRVNAIDADNDITLVSVQDDADKEMFNVNALDGEEVFVAGQNENVVEEMVDGAQVSTAATNVTITTEEITLAQALEALKTSKPKDKGKEWDDIQAKIDVDYQLAKRLQAQEQEELSDAEKATLFQQLLEKRRKHFAAKRAEEKRNKPLTKA
ncbi:hypothetical protein Tco_0721694 [Tanacetum coccineum]